MQDFMGNEIKVGDTIVYPGRKSSFVWMNTATVLRVDIDYLVAGRPCDRFFACAGECGKGKEVVLTSRQTLRNIVVVK